MVRLLSIDGGFNALPALMILAEIMERYKFDHPNPGKAEKLPYNFFSMIIGSGHGGLIAILLGKLRMPVDAALEAYCSLLAALPSMPAQNDAEKMQNAVCLEEELRRILSFEGTTADDVLQANSRGETTKVVVCVGQTTNMSIPYYIRNYPSRGMQTPPCTILQAAMACMADSTIYPTVEVGKYHRRVVLVEAPARFANPTKLLLTEAELIWKQGERVTLILSLGSGSAELLTVEAYRGSSSRIQRGVESEQVHQDLLSRLKAVDIYYRFYPRGEFGLSEDPARVQARIDGYLQDGDINDSVDAVVRKLEENRVHYTVELGDISEGHIVAMNVVTDFFTVDSVRVLDIGVPPRPSVVPNFLGRDDVLAKLRSYHFDNQVATERCLRISVLAGIGGSGKTQCVLKFALEYEQRIPNAVVYFVDARSKETLQQGLQSITRSMTSGLRADWSPWLLSSKEWMIILDNADDPSVKVLENIPQHLSGHVIITTRNSTYANLSGNFQELEALKPGPAVELLLSSSGYEGSPENKKAALEVVTAIGRLPLAIAHAAGYIRLHQCLKSYLEIYSQSRQQLLRTKAMAMFQDYDLSVASTIQMSLDKLPAPTQFLLYLLAEFHNLKIPLDVFQAAAKRQFSTPDLQLDISTGEDSKLEREALMNALCPDGQWSEAYFNELIEPCLVYSLLRVTRNGDTRMFSMHILVQTWIQSAHSTTEQRRLFGRLISSSLSRDAWAQIHLHRLIAPHIGRVVLIEVSWADQWALAFAMDEVGEFTWSQARFRDVLAYAETTFGDESPITLAIMSDLATSYDRSGVSIYDAGALALHQRVLTARLKLRGETDVETISTMSNIVDSLLGSWRNAEARTLNLKVLELLKANFGPEHPEVLRAEGRLATILFREGDAEYGYLMKLSMARKLETQRKVKEVEKLRGLENIAISVHLLGRYSEALYLFQRVASPTYKFVGPRHPAFIRTSTYMAGTLCQLGRFSDAIERLELVFKSLNPLPDGDESGGSTNHDEDRRNTPEGLSAQRLMCFVLFCSGQDAGEQYNSTVKAHLEALGTDHPYTKWVQKQLEDWDDPTFIDYAIRKSPPTSE